MTRPLPAEAAPNYYWRHTAIPPLLASRKWAEVGCVCWSAEPGLWVFTYCIVTEEWAHR